MLRAIDFPVFGTGQHDSTSSHRNLRKTQYRILKNNVNLKQLFFFFLLSKDFIKVIQKIIS